MAHTIPTGKELAKVRDAIQSVADYFEAQQKLDREHRAQGYQDDRLIWWPPLPDTITEVKDAFEILFSGDSGPDEVRG